MRGAPLIETRVCQYEDTPDHDLIIDRHPAAQNVWIVGGGSGHGFKHGPAVGKMVAGFFCLEERRTLGFGCGDFRMTDFKIAGFTDFRISRFPDLKVWEEAFASPPPDPCLVIWLRSWL